MVIGRAIIADVVTGRAAARAFTLMITVGGVAPVLAPLVGGLLADPIGWRGMLWTVVVLCAAMLVGVLLVIPRRILLVRRPADVSALDGVRTVLRTRAFRGPLAVFALSFGVMMAYISSSPFVYQNVVGLDEVGYGLAFGVNAAGLIGLGWVASHFVDRWSPRSMVRTAVAVQLAGTVTFLVLAARRRTRVAAARPDLRRGRLQRRDHGQLRRPGHGPGPARRGYGQRGPRLRPVRTRRPRRPLVGLGGESSAVVPALVMTVSSAGGSPPAAFTLVELRPVMSQLRLVRCLRP